MKRSFWLSVSVLFIVAILTASPAAAYKWKMDPAHSGIFFEVQHIYSKVRGHFGEFSGELFFNPDELAKSKVSFTVKVDSINTQVGKRDNHLRSPDFFDAKKYPTMSFNSTKITHTGGDKYILEGNMTVKKVTKPMKLEFILLGQKDAPFQKGQVVGGFETRFTLDRFDFGVGTGKFLKLGVVGKMVDVFISLEMVRKK